MTRVRTTCRICESRCGVLVDVDGARVVRILPDPEHPVSRGHACAKGLGFAAVHHGPHRVRQPRLDGERASWEEVLSRVGERLRAIRHAHGPDAVALFSGNAAGHSLGTVLGVSGLQRGLGTTRHYSALTLDNAEQFVVLEAVTGSPLHSFAADFARCDLAVLFGTDMLVSQPAQSQSNPRGIGHLKQLAARGGLWVLDPRPSRTAKAGHHLALRPSSDVAVLAWLLREALGRGVRDDRVRAGDLDALASAVHGFDLAGASTCSGLAQPQLLALRDALFAAERPLVWSGLGLLLGPDGTLGYWLTLALQLALGGLEAPGGWRTPPSPVDMGALARRLGLHAAHPTLRGRAGHPATLDTLPSADLAADIESGDVRALIVVGGNPALSLPEHERALAALRSLDLLVSIDLIVNDTATLADAVLPARSWLARDDVPLHLVGQRWADDDDVHLSLEPAAVPPEGEAREDLHILLDLADAAGVRAFDSRLAHAALRRLGGATLGRWAARALGPLGKARPLGPSHHADGTLHLAVPSFLDALAGWRPPSPGLRLVTSSRSIETMNHWLHDSRAAQRRVPVARMHPETALAHGVDAGEVWLDGAGSVRVQLVLDEGLARDTVVLPYGWGHLEGAGDQGGVNANTLVGSEAREPFTGQPISNGQPVRVRRA